MKLCYLALKESGFMTNKIGKFPISVAIITKNEAAHLPSCLQSIDFADQIVIVDSGSSDETRRIAEEFGCEVFFEIWKGFGPQKQSAIDKCRNPWILVLDADERIPLETAAVIKKIVQQEPSGHAGYCFPRKNFFQEKWIRHMGWWPDPVIRLFRKNLGRMSMSLVHEAIMIEGTTALLEFPIEHYTESRLSYVLKKIDHYSSLGAEQAYREGKRASAWSAGLRALLTFFQNYFLKLGFLDGAQGLTLSITDSINKFFKYSKISELQREAQQHRRSDSGN